MLPDESLDPLLSVSLPLLLLLLLVWPASC
jgi:hypothetical protein